MRQGVLVFTLVLVIGLATQTISKDTGRDLKLSKGIERDLKAKRTDAISKLLMPLCSTIMAIPVVGNLVGPLIGCSGSTSGTNLLTTLCPILKGIPTLGPILGSVLKCPGTTPGTDPISILLSGICNTVSPTGMPMTMPTMMPTVPGMMKPLASLNALACPLLSLANSVPFLGPMFVNSVNPPFFGCTITAMMTNMGK